MSVDSHTPDDLQKLEQYWADAECVRTTTVSMASPSRRTPIWPGKSPTCVRNPLRHSSITKKIGKLPNNWETSQEASLTPRDHPAQ
jgi:hypothetical protein